MNLNVEKSKLLCSIPGIVHGFFTRDGGVSSGPYASLNCSFYVKDSFANVSKNRARVLSYLNLNKEKLLVPHIVHGDHSLLIDSPHSHDVDKENADGLITNNMGYALGITYADCLPILLASLDGEIISVVHAGWRGIRNEIIIKNIALIRRHFEKRELVAAIGPAISPTSFVVDGEVLECFLKNSPDFVQKNAVDLVGIAIAQLKQSGITLIEKVGGFTDLDNKRYFSHRRDRGVSGRHLAVIAKISIEKSDRS